MDTSDNLNPQKEGVYLSNRKDPEAIVREIKRKTRRKYSSEEKIRIVLEGLRGEQTIAELCRREGISPNLYYNSKEFLEAGKPHLMELTTAFCVKVSFESQPTAQAGGRGWAVGNRHLELGAGGLQPGQLPEETCASQK